MMLTKGLSQSFSLSLMKYFKAALEAGYIEGLLCNFRKDHPLRLPIINILYDVGIFLTWKHN